MEHLEGLNHLQKLQLQSETAGLSTSSSGTTPKNHFACTYKHINCLITIGDHNNLNYSHRIKDSRHSDGTWDRTETLISGYEFKVWFKIHRWFLNLLLSVHVHTPNTKILPSHCWQQQQQKRVKRKGGKIFRFKMLSCKCLFHSQKSVLTAPSTWGERSWWNMLTHSSIAFIFYTVIWLTGKSKCVEDCFCLQFHHHRWQTSCPDLVNA